eukprot:2136004-Alexandrium_andersonii.AAC.1
MCIRDSRSAGPAVGARASRRADRAVPKSTAATPSTASTSAGTRRRAATAPAGRGVAGQRHGAGAAGTVERGGRGLVVLSLFDGMGVVWHALDD